MSTKSPLPSVYVTPRALLSGVAAREAVATGWAWALLGDLAFTAIEVSSRENGSRMRLGVIARAAFEKDAFAMPLALRAAIEARLAVLATPRNAFAGFDVSKPILMGVLNVTPDSFSDGGRYDSAEAAVAHGAAMFEAGAALIDVGGESTRPGAIPVGEHAEIARVVPVVRALKTRGVPVSVDTRHAGVMTEAIAAGAVVVNDISGLTDSKALEVVARLKVPVMLMHMQGEPRTMQDNPTYEWAPGDIYDYLEQRIAACVTAGIPQTHIAVDPGLGFGKTDIHNAEIMGHLAMFHGLECPLVIGASRKGFIGRMSRGEAAKERLPGSLAAALYAAGQGAQILRVHDVAETRQALAVTARFLDGP